LYNTEQQIDFNLSDCDTIENNKYKMYMNSSEQNQFNLESKINKN